VIVCGWSVVLGEYSFLLSWFVAVVYLGGVGMSFFIRVL